MLEAFAAGHRLQIERYVRGNPSWDFHFRDFEDGIGLIQVLYVGADSVLIERPRSVSTQYESLGARFLGGYAALGIA